MHSLRETLSDFEPNAQDEARSLTDGKVFSRLGFSSIRTQEMAPHGKLVYALFSHRIFLLSFFVFSSGSMVG